MAMPFDATLKELVASYPEDWLRALGVQPSGSVEVLSPDLSTVSAFGDVALRMGESICHMEFYASRSNDDRLRRFVLYNVLLWDAYGQPVGSFLVLLRPEANRADLDGQLGHRVAWEGHELTLYHRVVRVWEHSAEDWLFGGLGLAPLAPLGRLPEGLPAESAMRDIVERLVARIEAEAPANRLPEMLTASYILLGLRLPRERVNEFFQGVQAMKESSTYQAILEAGEQLGLAKGEQLGLVKGEQLGLIKGEQLGQVKEARRLVRRLAARRLGEPDQAAERSLEAIADIERLERMADRAFDAISWAELLDTP